MIKNSQKQNVANKISLCLRYKTLFPRQKESNRWVTNNQLLQNYKQQQNLTIINNNNNKKCECISYVKKTCTKNKLLIGDNQLPFIYI